MTTQTNNELTSQYIDRLDGIEILVNWAKSGEIDPWNVDIIDVTDKFLAKLLEIKQNNLRLTGRTLFFAAVLLKIKSDILEGLDPFKDEELETFEPDEELDDYIEENIHEEVKHSNMLSLKEAITRRTNVKKNRFRKVTLEELIKQLRKLEEVENKRKLVERHSRASRNYTHFTPDDILEMAHEEQIEDEITKLQDILFKLFETEEVIEFDKLVESGMDRVNTYLSLLFLASRSRINLSQKEFYSDLYITKEVG